MTNSKIKTNEEEGSIEGSAKQRAWCSFAKEMRERLEAKIGEIETMGCEDLDNYINCCTAALFFDLKANTFDHTIRLELARNKASD